MASMALEFSFLLHFPQRLSTARTLTPAVIVTGHTACGGCIAAHGLSPDTDARANPLLAFLGPLVKLRASLGPDATVDDLMVASVKHSVENVCQSEVS